MLQKRWLSLIGLSHLDFLDACLLLLLFQKRTAAQVRRQLERELFSVLRRPVAGISMPVDAVASPTVTTVPSPLVVEEELRFVDSERGSSVTSVSSDSVPPVLSLVEVPVKRPSTLSLNPHAKIFEFPRPSSSVLPPSTMNWGDETATTPMEFDGVDSSRFPPLIFACAQLASTPKVSKSAKNATMTTTPDPAVLAAKKLREAAKAAALASSVAAAAERSRQRAALSAIRRCYSLGTVSLGQTIRRSYTTINRVVGPVLDDVCVCMFKLTSVQVLYE
jgi:hypothetical protein